jgi:Kef-type K+ transport system membrane component KefB
MLIVIAATVLIVKAIIDYLGRRLMIKGMAPEEIDSRSSMSTKWSLMSNLKWALVCLGFGAAAILYDFLQEVISVTGGFGLMFIGAGVGYLVYFLIAWRWSEKEEHRDE